MCRGRRASAAGLQALAGRGRASGANAPQIIRLEGIAIFLVIGIESLALHLDLHPVRDRPAEIDVAGILGIDIVSARGWVNRLGRGDLGPGALRATSTGGEQWQDFPHAKALFGNHLPDGVRQIVFASFLELIQGVDDYLAKDKQRYCAPQFYFGPGKPGETPHWAVQTRMIRHQASREAPKPLLETAS